MLWPSCCRSLLSSKWLLKYQIKRSFAKYSNRYGRGREPWLFIQMEKQSSSQYPMIKININVGVEDIEYDPQLMLQCIIKVWNSTVEDIEQLFQYELRAGSSIFIWLFWIYERDRHTLHFLEHGYKGLQSVPYVNDIAHLSDQII